MMTAVEHLVRLWSDEPSLVDLLAFQAVAETAVQAVLDDALDPLALGISGPWGSGKTTVLRLIAATLRACNPKESEDSKKPDSRILVVEADPWKYDPTVGAKESLISEVLACLRTELEANTETETKALSRLKKLSKRVDWAKALRVTARASLMLQLPSVDDLTGLIRTDGDQDESGPRGLEAFREEFAQLVEADELQHVRRVVVLVDDLDRCLPETVIETLETIRLFLAVPKMSFVLAADEERVADALRTRYREVSRAVDPDALPQEEPAKLYLHKIVQTTIPIPALSRFDTEAYLFLLQLANRLDPDQFACFVEQCGALRLKAADLDELPGISGLDVTTELAFAARLTPLLYEKLRGNPRRIKRFLNDVHVREAIASRRGIALEPEIIAKLMVLEVLFRDEFDMVLGWLAHGELREKMTFLERVAGRPKSESTESEVSADNEADTDMDQRDETFSENLVRWAKLPPALSAVDLSPYLHLAASFSGQTLLDRGLPERLRDIAANLLSSSRLEQKSVADADLAGLSSPDAEALLQHLGRMGRDRPADQRKAVAAILRIARLHPGMAEAAGSALRIIPADEIQRPALLLFKLPEDEPLRPVLESWREQTTQSMTRNAIDTVLAPRRAR